jgi:hypothetical protein
VFRSRDQRQPGQLDQHKRLHGDDQRVVGAGRLGSLDHDEGLTSTSPSWKVPPGPDEFR